MIHYKPGPYTACEADTSNHSQDKKQVTCPTCLSILTMHGESERRTRVLPLLTL